MSDTTTPTPAEKAPSSLYKYALWVHVGTDAESCSEVDEEAGTNLCSDSGHFHAWCRLPNPLQEEDIRDRAHAAKARKIRQLRSSGSDANEVLETELETLAAEPDAKDKMATELVGADWAQDYLAAVRQAQLTTDPEAGEDEEPLFAHIEDDQRRLAELEAMPADDRPQDEYEDLVRHYAAYEQALREAHDAITQPKLESYKAMGDTDLLDLVRRKRIERLGQQEFLSHFAIHEWLSCTYRAREGELAFRDLEHLKGSAAEVLFALREAFTDLEQTAQSSGN